MKIKPQPTVNLHRYIYIYTQYLHIYNIKLAGTPTPPARPSPQNLGNAQSKGGFEAMCEQAEPGRRHLKMPNTIRRQQNLHNKIYVHVR